MEHISPYTLGSTLSNQYDYNSKAVSPEKLYILNSFFKTSTKATNLSKYGLLVGGDVKY